MQAPNTQRRELTEWGSPLADMTRETPHQVPDGYFGHAVREAMRRIREASGEADREPRKELQRLSPLLAGAERSMPFQVPTVGLLPWQQPTDTAPEGLPEMEETVARPAPVRRLPSLRVAAALLALGTAAWLIRLQIPSAEDPTPLPWASAHATDIDSLDSDAVAGFIRDTESLTTSETIGTEEGWTDEYKDIASGEPAAIDSGLSAIPEASLLAYVSETGTNIQ